jgi:Tol biopolymer transport system component
VSRHREAISPSSTRRIRTPKETSSLLPDGQSLLFVVDRLNSGPDTLGILKDGQRKDVLTIAGEALEPPVYSPTGHILYHRETSTPGVWAVPFSLDRLETTGTPFLVAPLGSHPTISTAGTLVYAENSISGRSPLVWFAPESRSVSVALNDDFHVLQQPQLSPDGRRVAMIAQSPGEGLVVIVGDLQRHTSVRIADRASLLARPTWRDDHTVAFARAGGPQRETIVLRAADGSGSEKELVPGVYPRVSAGQLVYARIALVLAETSNDAAAARIGGSRSGCARSTTAGSTRRLRMSGT